MIKLEDITLRDIFAAFALHAKLTSNENKISATWEAYEIADLMLEERPCKPSDFRTTKRE